ncbi:unnamed protein product [Phaeothamnion confervicola]
MRLFAILVSTLAASAASAAQGPIGPEAARHLLNRTGFEVRPEQVRAFAGLSRADAADRLLAGTVTKAGTPAPAWSGEFVSPRRLRTLDDAGKKQFQREQVGRAIDLKNWWVTEMLATRSPLTERMTLFWHNHFTSSLQKVKSATLLYRQNVLLRRHALGNFTQLLHAVSKDPAMLVYLDSASSRRGQPNENFAREVMELFTLGEGSYAEQDIREAARAFTGWSIDPETGEYLWRPFAHDQGTKTVLGRSGNLDGDDVLDLLLAQPKTAEFVVAKLWREFVSPEPDAHEVARIGRLFRASGYDIRTALHALLVSDAFYADENRGALVKSPVDFVIGTMRQFDVGYSDPLPLTFLLRTLGQDLFSPPNVKGWPGGDAWINSTTLLARRQFVERLFRVDESRMQGAMADAGMKGIARLPEARARAIRASLDIRFSSGEWLKQFGDPDPQPAMQKLLLPLPPAAGDAMPADAQARGMDLIRRLTADPAYQLK